MNSSELALMPPAITAPKFFGLNRVDSASPLESLVTLLEDQLHLLNAGNLRPVDRDPLRAKIWRLATQLALALRLHRGRPPSVSDALAHLVRRAGEMISADTVAAAATVAGYDDQDGEVALAPAARSHCPPVMKAGDRQKSFARLIASGADPADAYVRAGYAGGKPARGNALKLLATPIVRALVESARSAK